MCKGKEKTREKRRRLLFYRCMNEENYIFPVNRADARISMDVGNEFCRNKLLFSSKPRRECAYFKPTAQIYTFISNLLATMGQNLAIL